MQDSEDGDAGRAPHGIDRRVRQILLQPVPESLLGNPAHTAHDDCLAIVSQLVELDRALLWETLPVFVRQVCRTGVSDSTRAAYDDSLTIIPQLIELNRALLWQTISVCIRQACPTGMSDKHIEQACQTAPGGT